jgi:hypothetical protein
VIAIDPTPWAKAILAPLIEAAGYKVSFTPDPAAALVILSEGDEPPASAATHVTLEIDDMGVVAIDRYSGDMLRRLIPSRLRKHA